MQWTIKKRLATLTVSGLALVVPVSVTGYWGITSVEKASAQVAATGMAIRNHATDATSSEPKQSKAAHASS